MKMSLAGRQFPVDPAPFLWLCLFNELAVFSEEKEYCFALAAASPQLKTLAGFNGDSGNWPVSIRFASPFSENPTRDAAHTLAVPRTAPSL
jgi:hypothetical protein